MRHAIPCTLLLVLPLRAAEPPKVEEFAPHAAGVALAEVVAADEYDERPTDGDKGVRFKLKRVRGSGEFRETVDVVTAFGGLRPPGDVPKPSAPVTAAALKKGQRYWFAFASDHDSETHNQGVVGFWPEKDAKAAALEAAVKADAYRWHPRYDPQTKLTYGRAVEKDRWRVRVEKSGKVLWEKEIPGTPTDPYYFGLFQSPGGDLDVKMPVCGQILLAETSTRLESGNEFGLAAGPYYVCTGFDPETGKRHVASVRLPQGPSVVLVNREYDPETDRPKREERFEFLKAGGQAAGAPTEDWYKKTARRFDAAGKPTAEAVFRYDGAAEPDRRWVKVTKE